MLRGGTESGKDSDLRTVLSLGKREYGLDRHRGRGAGKALGGKRERLAAKPGPRPLAGLFRPCDAEGRGIRLLRQDPWETLCSFLLSQCNNIPRIRKILEVLCRNFGRKIRWEGRTYCAFPEPEVLAAQTPETLAPLRCGYRAEYLLDAAEKTAGGAVELEKLREVPTEQARACLRTIRGVGTKVADCVCLYGLGHRDAFPVDVWIRRALQEHFPPDFDPSRLGPAAGLAQQYLFYFRRVEKKEPRQTDGSGKNPDRKNWEK